MILENKSILITGGTGSFGKAFVKKAFEFNPTKIIVFSRDELKQWEMRNEIFDERLVFFVGDVRDRDRLYRAFDGVDIVIHAAALKQIPSCEYNPFEAIRTNVIGAQNVIDAAIDRGIQRIIALSSDKAVNPINLYGATKLCSEKLFVSGNSYTGRKETKFSVVRYGNVMGSRGSVIPLFKKIAEENGTIPITDERMTRFWITLERGAEFVIESLKKMRGGEIFVPKLPSMKVIDLAETLAPHCKKEIVGIRPGEKIHEVLISEDEARTTFVYADHFVIRPFFHWWTGNGYPDGGLPVEDNFRYDSLSNPWRINLDGLRNLIQSKEFSCQS